MADNIGTITVAIEAQTDQLKRGLQSAESEVKKSAKNMEDATERLAERAEKSWTEFASKMGVIQQVAGIAKNAVKALADSAAILGNESASAAEKYSGVLNTIRDSGIPILSEAVSIGQSLRDVFDGTTQELAKWADELERINKMNEQVSLVLQIAEYNKSLKDVVRDEQTRTRLLKEQGESMTKFVDAHRLRARQLQRKFDAEIESMKGVQGEGAKDFAKRRDQSRALHKQILAEMFERARFADKQANDAWWETVMAKRSQIEKVAEMEEQARRAKEKADEESAKRAADKTLDLETRLSIMRAKAEGDEEKAKTLAIEARYKRMAQGATKAQLAIISQMQAIEMAGSVASGGGTSVASGGGTSSISTAAGSFTVATGGRSETKKQTSLLRRIADSNEKVVEQLTKGGSSGATIIVAS